MKKDSIYYKYFRLQLTGVSDDKELLKHTIDLVHFARLFRLPLRPIQDEHMDSFLLEIPDDDYQACQILNVVEAYCQLHKIAHEACADLV